MSEASRQHHRAPLTRSHSYAFMAPPVALSSAWLLAGLLALALVAFALAAYGWQQSRRRARRPPAALSGSDELDRLGLSEVRPRSVSHPDTVHRADDDDTPVAVRNAPSAPPDDEPMTTPPVRANHDPMEDSDAADLDETGVSSARPISEPPSTAPPPASGLHVAPRSPLWDEAEPDAVAALLVSLGAAIGAQSVALLRYDEGAGAYAVDALAGQTESAQTTIAAAGSALHQVPGDRSISLLEGDALRALRYHADPDRSVEHAAALALDGLPERVLLIADGAVGTEPFAARHLTLLGEYADLLGRLLGADGAARPAAELSAEDTGAAEEEDTEPDADAQEETEPVRPRADIIAEEMAAARAAERPLALALVVPRDAEAVARGGREAVSTAEHALFERLRGVEGSDRVEHFGELMAGVFCHTGPTFVEAWAERVAADGPPVHVGVALLRARHLDAEALRADAAAALRAAYERGEDCVILE